jgi:hypothetical protein
VGSGLRACAKAREVASVEDEHAERADVPAAHRPDVDALRPADDPVPEREAASQLAEEDENHRLDDYFSGMPYPETQLLTVAQSRFWKNASMYAARSVR